MVILGLSLSSDTHASLLVDGEIKSCIGEERLSRIKNYTGFPFRAIKEVLKEYKVKCFITYPNNDVGSDLIIKELKKLNYINKNVLLYKSLGRKDYWGILNLIREKQNKETQKRI